MPTLDFTGTTVFSQITTNQVAYTSTVVSTPTSFQFFVESGADNDAYVEVTGTGFTYDGSGFPTSGTVTGVTIDSFNLRGNQPYVPDIFITGLNADLTDLVVTGTHVQQTDAFWSTIQAGNDTILTSTEGGWFFGDFLEVSGTENLTGGDDTITAAQTGSGIAAYTLLGDADQVFVGAQLTGGNDQIDITSPGSPVSAAGDAWHLNGGTVIGGDDTITVAEGGAAIDLSGDLVFMSGASILQGGADSLTGSNTVGDLIYGEVAEQSEGSVIGGGDELLGRGGNDSLFGDVDILSGGDFAGGNDTLRGGEGDDQLFGDFQTNTSTGTVSGGNDQLFGDAGDDLLVGNGGNDLLDGGADSDTLEGGDGADTLDGGDGADTLDGGAGDDTVRGDGGGDTVRISSGSDSIEGGASNDTYDASGSGSLDNEVISVTVDQSGNGTVTKTGGGGTDTFSSIETFIADETAGIDVITVSGNLTAGQVTGVSNGAVGSFTPDGGGAPVAFGGSGQPTINDILAGSNGGPAGTYQITSGEEDGATFGNIAVSSFETINFNVVCFGPGTGIATPQGRRAVETLAIGDPVVTAEGRAVPVKWIGRQTVLTALARERMQPVRIRAGALGRGLPHRDLVVTADHGMILDGLVINASALVNGQSIDWVPLDELPERVTYYHVETEHHNVILAEGAASETFVDYLGRRMFDNFPEYLTLYGAERLVCEMDRPRIGSARLLPGPIRARLGLSDKLVPMGSPRLSA
ncbi:Hint domain-containing protein [Marinovum sp.]|uniref:Hint domain-containing protein n=1 Tax=Marinovum sp. TaxID=2024839 RepID=UPI002B264725|nr:Hint domain-containing protein [Marinovum sp.]